MADEIQEYRNSGKDFARLRRKSYAQGESDLLARLGTKDTDEAIRLIMQARQTPSKPADKPDAQAAAAVATVVENKNPQKPAETDEAYEKRISAIVEKTIGAKLSEAMAPFAESLKAIQDDKAARAAADKEAAENAAAAQGFEKEMKWWRETVITDEFGADPTPKKLKRLEKLFLAELADLEEKDPEEFEEKFGESVGKKKRLRNMKEILDGIREDTPSLFKEKPAADPNAAGAGGAADPGKKPEEKKPGSTSTSATNPAGAASPKNRVFDATALSKEEWAKFGRMNAADRENYKKQWHEGRA